MTADKRDGGHWVCEKKATTYSGDSISSNSRLRFRFPECRRVPRRAGSIITIVLEIGVRMGAATRVERITLERLRLHHWRGDIQEKHSVKEEEDQQVQQGCMNGKRVPTCARRIDGQREGHSAVGKGAFPAGVGVKAAVKLEIGECLRRNNSGTDQIFGTRAVLIGAATNQAWESCRRHC